MNNLRFVGAEDAPNCPDIRGCDVKNQKAKSVYEIPVVGDEVTEGEISHTWRKGVTGFFATKAKSPFLRLTVEIISSLKTVEYSHRKDSPINRR